MFAGQYAPKLGKLSWGLGCLFIGDFLQQTLRDDLLIPSIQFYNSSFSEDDFFNYQLLKEI